eukprot:CAMPEP_0206607214 /NCGR_PEP_ID=MMETSP0325_2-20121206/51986_1 /ASSEMBLY_ACC=CAM_ASM_000347 /TAXON_ID=2866 /ORGANISM="Crypthecodinium cohnii, Strain Seligo" /LENGTH=463 /DNA_ID=CAMNT_0054124123 /DNA_START=78 /DNA_END=1468 /DNA_ORIENTATION=-
MRNLWVVPSEAVRAEANQELREAAKAGDVEAVKAALRKGAKVNQRFDYGLTALHFAAIYNHADVAAALVIAGAKTNLQTKDEAQATPAMLADASKNQAVLNVLGEKALLVNPLRRRFLGPTTVSLVIIVNTILAFILTDPNLRWNGWTEATGEFLGGATSHRHLYLPLCVLSLLLLLIVNTKNPGYVRPEEVAYASDLWNEEENPDRVIVDDENFGVVWMEAQKFSPGAIHANCGDRRMSRTAPFVAGAAGDLTTTVLLWGHASQQGTMPSSPPSSSSPPSLGCSAWSPSLRTSTDYHEAGIGDWPLYLYLLFAGLGAFCSTILFSFGIFHVSTLFLNYNTKIVWKGKDRGTWCQLNSAEVMGQIFCAPCEFRACGAPEAFPLRKAESSQTNNRKDVFGLHELCVPTKLDEGAVHEAHKVHEVHDQALGRTLRAIRWSERQAFSPEVEMGQHVCHDCGTLIIT